MLAGGGLKSSLASQKLRLSLFSVFVRSKFEANMTIASRHKYLHSLESTPSRLALSRSRGGRERGREVQSGDVRLSLLRKSSSDVGCMDETELCSLYPHFTLLHKCMPRPAKKTSQPLSEGGRSTEVFLSTLLR